MACDTYARSVITNYSIGKDRPEKDKETYSHRVLVGEVNL